MPQIRLLPLFLALTVIVGCASLPKIHKKPLYIDTPGEEEELVFEEERIKISVRPLVEPNETAGNELLAELFGRHFIFIKMEITNKSEQKVLYNPSYTSILTGATDYKKPLDYSSLYYIIKDTAGKGAPEARLARVRNMFYDLNVTIPPGKSVSKFLIFTPVKRDSRRRRAAFSIRELYIGTKTIFINFPFKVKVREKAPTPEG